MLEQAEQARLIIARTLPTTRNDDKLCDVFKKISQLTHFRYPSAEELSSDSESSGDDEDPDMDSLKTAVKRTVLSSASMILPRIFLRWLFKNIPTRENSLIGVDSSTLYTLQKYDPYNAVKLVVNPSSRMSAYSKLLSIGLGNLAPSSFELAFCQTGPFDLIQFPLHSYDEYVYPIFVGSGTPEDPFVTIENFSYGICTGCGPQTLDKVFFSRILNEILSVLQEIEELDQGQLDKIYGSKTSDIILL